MRYCEASCVVLSKAAPLFQLWEYKPSSIVVDEMRALSSDSGVSITCLGEILYAKIRHRKGVEELPLNIEYKNSSMAYFFNTLYAPILSESLSEDTRISDSLFIGARGTMTSALNTGSISEEWCTLSELDGWIKKIKSRLTVVPHCYNYTVTPRRKTSTKKCDVAGTSTLWCDIDGVVCTDWTKEKLNRLIKYSLPPSAVVDSGWGVHLYWFLDSYLPFADYNKSMEKAVFCNGFLSWFVGGDSQTSSLEHLMRLPGSINCKAHPYKHTYINMPENPVRYKFEEIYKTLCDYKNKFLKFFSDKGDSEQVRTLDNLTKKNISHSAVFKESSYQTAVYSIPTSDVLNKLKAAAGACPLLSEAFNNSANISYHEWISIGAVLAQKFSSETAYDVFRAISLPGNTSHDPEGNIQRQFLSLQASSLNPYNCYKLPVGSRCSLCAEGKCKNLYNVIYKIFREK